MSNLVEILLEGPEVKMKDRKGHPTEWTLSDTIPTLMIPPLTFTRAVMFCHKISKLPYADGVYIRYIPYGEMESILISLSYSFRKKIDKQLTALSKYYSVEVTTTMTRFGKSCLIKIYDVNNFV